MKYSDALFWMFMVFIMIAISNSGCSKPYNRTDRIYKKSCDTEAQRDKLASFIIKCSEAANPKSDEEGEDLVIQCERTGINTICPQADVCREEINKGGFLGSPSTYGDWGPCK